MAEHMVCDLVRDDRPLRPTAESGRDADRAVVRPVTTEVPAAAFDYSEAEVGDETTFAGVGTVLEPEPGRWEIYTSIIDPRGEAGSSEASVAIAMCEFAVARGATYVSVHEKDGTTFVLYGHPSYGDVCTEV